MLTWRERLQRFIKKEKKKASKQTLIAFMASLLFVIGFNIADRAQAVTTNIQRDDQSLLTATMVGDMMFGRNIEIIADKYGYDHLFKYVQPYFQVSDYITGNLENPIVLKEGYPKADKWIHLKTEPAAAQALARVGFDTVNLANNNMKDYGKRGLLDTLRVLRQAGIEPVGAGSNLERAKRISYQTINGIRIATLGLTDVLPKGFRAHKKRSGVAPADPDVFFPLVAKADKNADLVIVHIHWGLEYDSGFHPRQRDLAHALADAGADIIVGHHPHVLEPVEVYKDTVIFYSLGNFIFDQGWSRTKESVLVQYKLYPDGRARIELTPLMIREGQPRPLASALNVYRREKIFAQVSREMLYTSKWRSTWKRDGEKIVREVDHSRVIKDVKQ